MIKNKNGSWILCVSKKLPGRLYHYNVVTKEAVWNLSDVRLQRKPFNNETPTTKWTFPEPAYSPDSSTGNVWIEQQTGRTLSPKDHAFSQAAFPKYGPNEAFCPATAPQRNSAGMPFYDFGPNRSLFNYNTSKPFDFDRREQEGAYFDQAYAMNRSFEQPYQNWKAYHKPNLFSQNGNQLAQVEKFPHVEKYQRPNFTNYRMPNEKIWPSNLAKNEINYQRSTQQNPFLFKSSDQRPAFFVKSTNLCKDYENPFAIKTASYLFDAPAPNKPEGLRHNPLFDAPAPNKPEGLRHNPLFDAPAPNKPEGLRHNPLFDSPAPNKPEGLRHNPLFDAPAPNKPEGLRHNPLFDAPAPNKPEGLRHNPLFDAPAPNKPEGLRHNPLFDTPAPNKPEVLRHNPFLVKKTETTTCNCKCSHEKLTNKKFGLENTKTRSISTSMEDLLASGDYDKIENRIFKTPIRKYPTKENLSETNLKNPVDSWPAKAVEAVVEDVDGKPIKIKELEENTDNKNDIKSNLPETDLRHMLTARRRKISETNEEHGPTQVKKIKTAYDPEQKRCQSPKKKVTFDLGVEEYSDLEAYQDQERDEDAVPKTVEDVNEPVDVEPEDTEDTGPTYFVPDTEVLLTKYPMLEELVQLNDQYALLIPQTVKSEVESLGVGLCNGRSNVMNARQVLRKLDKPPEYICVQSSEEAEAAESAECTDDSILGCCLQALEDGFLVWLVTDNEQLHKKAETLDINSTTVLELKQHIDSINKEVSFELKKTVVNNTNKINSYDNENVTGIPVDCTRGKLFDSNNVDCERIQFFRGQVEEDLVRTSEMYEISRNTAKLTLNDNEGISETNNKKDSKQLAERTAFKNKLYSNFEIKRTTNKEFNNEKVSKELTEKVIADDKTTFSFNNNLYSNFKIKRPANKELGHEEDPNFKTKVYSQFKILDRNFSFLENGCQEMASTDSKKKITSINSYNLNEHLMRYYVKNSVVEERIVRRFDEWLCSFSQILEVTLLDTMKSLSIPLPVHEDPQMPLSCLVECIGLAIDNRTTRLLTQRLSLAFSSCYVNNGKGTGGLTLCLTPNGFMTMLGYGTLLIKCLKTIHPECKELEEGEILLEQLLNSIENGSERQSANWTPVHKNTEVTDQPARATNFVKKSSDILDYLKNNCPSWKYSAHNDAVYNDTKKLSQAKVLRTTGSKLGRVTLNFNKTFSLNSNKQKQDEPDKAKEHKTAITTKEFIQNVKKLSGPKLLKKLVVESTHLPPKMQEIDIEKRENVNKEILNMIESIVAVNNGDETNGEEKEYKIAKKTEVQRTVSDNGVTKNNSPGENSSDFKLCYSEESETPLGCNGTQFSKHDSKKTHKLKQSPTFTVNINEEIHAKNDNCAKNNNDDVNENKNFEVISSDKTLDNDKSSCTVDSGFHENTVYCFIRKFLAVVTKTFIDVNNFITFPLISSLVERQPYKLLIFRKNAINKYYDEEDGLIREAWLHGTVMLRENMDHIIHQLENIKDRNVFGTLSPSLILNCDAAANDVEIRTYRQIIKKLLLQARTLRDALLILENDMTL